MRRADRQARGETESSLFDRSVRGGCVQCTRRSCRFCGRAAVGSRHQARHDDRFAAGPKRCTPCRFRMHTRQRVRNFQHSLISRHPRRILRSKLMKRVLCSRRRHPRRPHRMVFRQRGFEVTVVDRQPGPALETSFANGSQISVSQSDPGPACMRRSRFSNGSAGRTRCCCSA